jgi:zinc transport system ATP-binding protein
MFLLKCKDLCLGYDGKSVISDLTFDITIGNYLCIVGENGSGKSTLMKTILGLKTPISGELSFEDGFRRTEIGYLPQQTAVQKDFPATVREVVLSGCLNRGGSHLFYTKMDKKLAVINMEKLGVLQIEKRCYRELSGGQQQRVLLARALCATTRLILLDEPTVGLDIQVASDLYSLIETINQSGITVIMISHDIQTAVKYATHILHLGTNSIVYYGTKQDYLNTEIGYKYA